MGKFRKKRIKQKIQTMKTLLHPRKRFFISMLILFLGVGSLFGQTWSSSPSLNSYTAIGNNSSFSCSFGTVTRNEIQAKVTNLTSTKFTVQFRKENGGTFGSSGTAVLIDNTECNEFPISGGGTLNYSSGSSGLTWTNATHGVTPGTSKTFYVRIKPSTTNWFITLPITITATAGTPCGMPNGSNSTASNKTTSSFTANWQAVSGANYYNVNVKKCSDPNYNNALSFQTSSSNTSMALSGLDCGECYQFQVQAVCNSGAGTWSTSSPSIQLLQPTIPSSSSTTFSNVTQTSFKATWSPVSGAIGYRVNYTTCTGTFTLQDLPTSTNSITINSLSANTQYKIQIRAVYANQCFSDWSPSSPCVTTQTNSCVTWIGTPPTGEKLDAANYLCSNGIIQNSQNGTENANLAITRELMAKISYLGLYKGATPNSPAAYFPVPFTDMQGSSSPWLTAVKTLSYLQFNDDTTPFDRDFINFRPNDPLARKYVIKLLMEAFNIPKSTATPSPFTDVPTSDPMYGYIKKAHELGLITGNSVYTPDCQTGTCFHPNADITREDVFVLLYRILTSTNPIIVSTRPTPAELNNISKYFVPGNYRTENSGMVPELAKGNFNHYQKTSFSIAGRGVPLDFTHTYNSFLTELPKGYFEEVSSGQTFTPLGIGWTHTYNIYAQKVDGYTFGGVTEPTKLMVYYPDGSINSYNYTTGAIDGVGNYDVMTKAAISGGERITITTKGQMKYVFENANNGKFYFIKSIKDRNSNGVKVNWTAYSPQINYRITSVQEEFNNNTTGRSLTFNYPSTFLNILGSVTDNSIGRTISFNVNLPTKSLTTYTDPKGQVTSYTYDDFNNYNKSNLLTQITLPKGNKIQNNYVQRKLTSSKTFAQNGVASSTTNVNWTQSYTAAGPNSTSTVVDPQLRSTGYIYNDLGNPTSIAAPANTITVNSYGTGLNANLPTSITVDGINSTMSYDAKGNLLSASKNGITNNYTYTSKNDVSTHTDGRGFTTNYSYDANGNATSVQRPSGGGSTSIARNSFGQASTVTNPSGITSEFFYNTNGILNRVKMPLNIETNSTYDAASRLLSVTDANSRTNSYLYDSNDNLTQSKDANNELVQHTYDQNDNHLSIKNPKNETQSNAYKFDDDLLLSESFGPHTKSYTYNTDGTLATHTRGNGTFTYTYDSNTGRLLNDGQTQYSYDSRGNVSTITNTNGTLNLNYDNNDRMTSYTDYYNQTVAYTYDNNNNVQSITYPGNKTVNYVYDGNNRCTSVTDWNGKVTTYTYFADDRIQKITLPNGTYTDYTYDAAGRPTGISNKKSNGTVISSYAFTLDQAGNHLTETINEPSIVAGLQTIANATINYGSADYNRISTQGSTSFTHNTAGGITQAGANVYTYDLNDNLLTAPNSTFSYDGAGNRRAKTVSGTNTRYVLSILGMSQVLMENNGSNAVQNYYVYGPTGLLYRIKANNTNQYYHYDFRGSTTAITNEAQTVTHCYSYDPFGKVLASTEADFNPYRYVGKHGVAYENDKLVFMRARYYDPSIGRFLSEDPVWNLNLYPNANNNPLIMVDPKGEAAFLTETLDFFGRNHEVFTAAIPIVATAAKYTFVPVSAAIKSAGAITFATQAAADAWLTSTLGIVGSSSTTAATTVGATAGTATSTSIAAAASATFVGLVALSSLAIVTTSLAVLSTNPDLSLKYCREFFGNEKGLRVWKAWYNLPNVKQPKKK